MDQLTQVLQRLADQFGVGVDYLWPLLVAYTRWVNLAMLIADVVVLIAYVILYVKIVPWAFREVRNFATATVTTQSSRWL